MLILVNKKISSKNRTLFNLSLTENLPMIMLYNFRAKQWIFDVPILVNQVEKPNLAANAGFIVLTLLLEFIKALVFLA